MRHLASAICLAIAAMLLGAALEHVSAHGPSYAVAQSQALDVRSARARDDFTNPQEALGRTFVSEGGWWSPADQYMVWTVYLRRLEVIAPRVLRNASLDKRIVWIGKRYSTKSHPPSEVRTIAEKSKTRTPRQQWINGLTRRCSEPKLWPKLKKDGVTSHPPWSVYEKRCERIMKRAGDFMRGEFQANCQADRTVDHWGGPVDDKRARRSGWIRVDFKCTEGGIEYTPTNHAWCDPGLSDCETERLYAYSG